MQLTYTRIAVRRALGKGYVAYELNGTGQIPSFSPSVLRHLENIMFMCIGIYESHVARNGSTSSEKASINRYVEQKT